MTRTGRINNPLLLLKNEFREFCAEAYINSGMRNGGNMNSIQNIKSRRSIRKFKPEPIGTEVIKEIVEAARFAPSWKNSQTVSYTAVYDREKIKNMAKNGMCGFSHNTEICLGAPLLIIVTTKDKRSGYERDGSFSTSKGTHWQSFDAGAAAQTFCLLAHEYGLGTVIMGIYDEDVIRSVAEIPEGMSVSAIIAIGVPDEAPGAPRRKPVEELLRII